ncbi:hypothetical protein Gotri_023107, partial [Gossypium trilobum]|nr:hypothetical protein [Gossypium trilobum]
ITAHKTNVCFSEGVSDALGGSLCRILGFKNVQSKLQSWEKRSLSLAGMATLAQSVLLAIPSYFMQSTLIPKGHCEEVERLVHQFVWGSSSSGQKVALDHNTSFMMKLSFKLVTDSKALWVQVLCAKYGVANRMLETLSRSRCSFLWRALTKTNLDLECLLTDMVSNDGTWNLDLFRLWLLKIVIQNIIRVPPPHSTASVDMIIWGGSSASSFSIKSAYGKLQKSSCKPKEDVWKIPFKCQRPQRVRFFIWLALKQRLLTNMERVQRGLSHRSTCGVSGHITEDALHAIRDCPAGTYWSSNDTIKVSYSWAEQFMMTTRGPTSSFQIPFSCSKLSESWVYLNTNGSVKLEDGSATAGGIVQNRNGKWIFGFNRFLRSCSVSEAELWGILDGLGFLINQGYDKWSICHIPREENQEADSLVKLAHVGSQGLQVFEVSPYRELGYLM